MSFSDSRGSFANSPNFGSAPHGGIARVTTAFLTARAHGRASVNVVSDIGAISPARWHDAQFLNRIGATSLVNVTGAAAFAGVWARGSACAERTATMPTPPRTRPRDTPAIFSTPVLREPQGAAQARDRVRRRPRLR